MRTRQTVSPISSHYSGKNLILQYTRSANVSPFKYKPTKNINIDSVFERLTRPTYKNFHQSSAPFSPIKTQKDYSTFEKYVNSRFVGVNQTIPLSQVESILRFFSLIEYSVKDSPFIYENLLNSFKDENSEDDELFDSEKLREILLDSYENSKTDSNWSEIYNCIISSRLNGKKYYPKSPTKESPSKASTKKEVLTPTEENSMAEVEQEDENENGSSSYSYESDNEASMTSQEAKKRKKRLSAFLGQPYSDSSTAKTAKFEEEEESENSEELKISDETLSYQEDTQSDFFSRNENRFSEENLSEKRSDEDRQTRRKSRRNYTDDDGGYSYEYYYSLSEEEYDFDCDYEKEIKELIQEVNKDPYNEDEYRTLADQTKNPSIDDIKVLLAMKEKRIIRRKKKVKVPKKKSKFFQRLRIADNNS